MELRPVPLPEGEAHLWWVRPEDVPEDRMGMLRGWMDPSECERHDRYVFARDQKLFLVTRALVRTVLSRYTGVAPGHWGFTANPWGRPEVARPDPHRHTAGGTALRFNLANTDGMVVLLVARGREVGVDVERIDRPAPLDVAERFFAPAEVAALRSLASDARPRRFFDYWTLKESYIKARGMGLAIPLEHFAFTLGPGDSRGGITVALDPSLHDDASAWQFVQVQVPPARGGTTAHLVAVAVRRDRGADATLVLYPADHLYHGGNRGTVGLG